MKHHIVVIGLLAAAGLSLAVGSSSAAPESLDCQQGDGARAYDQGYRLQAQLLRRLFERNFTCLSFEKFAQAVRVPLPPPSTEDLTLQCRDVGLIFAMDDTIYQIAEQCTIECAASGDFFGRMEAAQYCRAAEAVGIQWVVPPIPMCDLASEQACRAAFESEVRKDPDCSAFADADSTYQETLNLACAFVSAP